MVRAKAVQQSANFEHRKRTFLGKGDKSSAGGIDVHAREVCAVINEREDCFTTSSCSGRAFLWQGEGVKSTSDFSRYRVTHELIPEAEPYFDLASLAAEVVDGAWEEERHRTRERAPAAGGRLQARGVSSVLASAVGRICGSSGGGCSSSAVAAGGSKDPVVWLRFEPFILHVCCRDFQAAAGLIAAARHVFKNVGVQSWSDSKVMVALWGDEGLEMVLTSPCGKPLFAGQATWLQEQVNSRHRRNWAKIDRFTEAVRALPAAPPPLPSGLFVAGRGDTLALDSTTDDSDQGGALAGARAPTSAAHGGSRPRHFDIIGDVAVLSSAPEAVSDRDAVAAAVLRENGRVKVVAARRGGLQGEHRAAGHLEILAGPERRPLMTTHSEFGVRYVVNLEAMFFNPRMGPERQRICKLVQADEHVCVLFAGCCPEALQLADKTSAASIVAVELNADAVKCARRSLDILAKRDRERASRVRLIEGDARAAIAELAAASFHRVLAPRPKGKTDEEDDVLARDFLLCLVPLLRPGGCCHWYDFVADWEFPQCERSASRITAACAAVGRKCTILRRAAANNKPVAERQYRTVIDFSVE